MKRSRRAFATPLLVAALGLVAAGCRRDAAPVAASPAAGASSTAPRPAEEAGRRGKGIYRGGTSPSGDAMTAVLNGDVEAPASALPCANCHGLDARGRAEGALRAPDLTWEALTRPYGVAEEPGGRAHAPYDEASLRRAIAMGFDPSGHPLSPAMPRYRFSSRDLDDLVAYLRGSGEEPDPGVTGTSIRVGCLLPGGGIGDLGSAVRGILDAYFDDVNRRGGVYGRRIELRAAGAPPGAEGLRAFCDRERPFALVGSSLDGDEDSIMAAVRELEVPMIGPMVPLADLDRSPGRYVFHLMGGADRQARALVAFARGRGWVAPGKVGLVAGEDRAGRRVAEIVARELRAGGVEPVRPPSGRPAADVASALRAEGVEVVFWLAGRAGLGDLVRAAGRASWGPTILSTGAQAGDVLEGRAGPGFGGSLYLAFPCRPEDRTPEALAEYRELAARCGLPAGHVGVHLAVLASARVLVEGLRGAGRRLTREALIASLERPGGVPTGLTPRLDFRDGRRLGATEVTIFELDPGRNACRPAGTWGRDGGGPDGGGSWSR